jgi:hypothetical protein
VFNRGVSFFQFVYRANPDKTIDTICAFCCLTVASAGNEADLHHWEAAHVCPAKAGPIKVSRAADCASLALQHSKILLLNRIKRVATPSNSHAPSSSPRPGRVRCS